MNRSGMLAAIVIALVLAPRRASRRWEEWAAAWAAWAAWAAG